MRTHGRTHLARSLVAVFGAVLVIAGAGIAAARTMSGPPWRQPLLAPACEPAATTTDGTVSTDATVSTDGTTATDVSTASTDCTTTGTTDPAKAAADAQAFFDAFANGCGTAVLGDAKLTDATTDPATVQAFGSLADALGSGQVDHMVQSVRVLLENCQAHSNEGLSNALYHHGLNWARHYQHELWLEQKFADKWPDGKPGGGSQTGSETTHGASGESHGNPHLTDPSWSPGSGHGNALGHNK